MGSLGPGPHVMASGALAGATVFNRSHEELGTLAHVMLDVASGRIAYAVLAHGGVLGLGEKFFAIPWETLAFDATRECFVLDVARESLAAAKGFDRDQWPSNADPAPLQ